MKTIMLLLVGIVLIFSSCFVDVILLDEVHLQSGDILTFDRYNQEGNKIGTSTYSYIEARIPAINRIFSFWYLCYR